MLAAPVRYAARAAIHVVLFFAATALTAEEVPERLTLEQALAEAFAANPSLEIRRAEIEQAEARLVEARTYPHDPELVAGARRRTGRGESSLDYDVALVQLVEVGRQRSRRVDRASAEIAAARHRLISEERLLAARVEAAFVEALRRRELLAVERANTALARSLVEVARKRFESGATAQMELNLAQVQAGRAERELRLAEGEHEVAKALLAETVGRDSTRPTEPEGELAPPERTVPPLAELTVTAGARADLEALRSDVEAASARIELERRSAVPNLAFELSYGEEEGTDRLIGGGIGIRLPLFNRNQGGIAAALAAQRQATGVLAAEELRMKREIGTAVARYQANRTASAELELQVLGTLEQNLTLLERSFAAGKTSWTEVLVFRREFVEVQRDHIETLAGAWLAGIEIDLAAGQP